MRQTSRAVALLLTLESTQAAFAPVSVISVQGAAVLDYTTQFNGVPPANQLKSRTAPYTVTQPTGTTWGTITAYAANITNSGSSAVNPQTVTAGSKCVPCIGKGGVWCSRTYAYVHTGTLVQGLQGQSTAATGMSLYPNGYILPSTTTQETDGNLIGGVSLDGGSCCATTTTAMNTNMGISGLNASAVSFSTAAGSAKSNVGHACVAFQKAVYVVASTSPTVNASQTPVGIMTAPLAIAYTSWWCSNGLYMKSTGVGAAINNFIQPLFGSNNQRTELAFAACPQLQVQCGNEATVLHDINTNDKTITIANTNGNISGPTNKDKCTWVASSLIRAPTFKMMKNNASTGKGLVTTNWVLHSMEYTGAAAVDGGLQINGSSTGFQIAASGLALGNAIPIFDMPQSQFNMLRTWYGTGVAQTATVNSNWLSPYQNQVTYDKSAALAVASKQWMGNVANLPASTFGTDYGSMSVTGTTSGATAAAVSYDGRVVRYFPAQVAAASWTAGNALYGSAGTYAAAITTYTTAKTNWDAYVAILKKNAKADAFAAAFSPPKAPTVPPLPAQPWVPGAYGGYIKQTPAENIAMVSNTGALVATYQPSNQQFWTSLDAANTTGGWGTFTAQIMTYREGFGKSFGTIGYSSATDTAQITSGAVWNYKWACAATGVAGTLCDKTYTASQSGSVVTTSSAGSQQTNGNTIKLYVAVSLWSIGDTGTLPLAAPFATNSSNLVGGTVTTQYNDLQIVFAGSTWLGSKALVGYTALTAAAQPAAASSLTGIAGAQALAASAAAALAAAAALY